MIKCYPKLKSMLTFGLALFAMSGCGGSSGSGSSGITSDPPSVVGTWVSSDGSSTLAYTDSSTSRSRVTQTYNHLCTLTSGCTMSGPMEFNWDKTEEASWPADMGADGNTVYSGTYTMNHTAFSGCAVTETLTGSVEMTTDGKYMKYTGFDMMSGAMSDMANDFWSKSE